MKKWCGFWIVPLFFLTGSTFGAPIDEFLKGFLVGEQHYEDGLEYGLIHGADDDPFKIVIQTGTAPVQLYWDLYGGFLRPNGMENPLFRKDIAQSMEWENHPGKVHSSFSGVLRTLIEQAQILNSGLGQLTIEGFSGLTGPQIKELDRSWNRHAVSFEIAQWRNDRRSGKLSIRFPATSIGTLDLHTQKSVESFSFAEAFTQAWPLITSVKPIK